MPDIKQKITDGFEQNVATLPIPDAAKQKVEDQFLAQQNDYAYKVTHAFSDSLQQIFRVSAVLMLLAAVLVFMIKEKPLKSASPDDTPGM